MATDLISKRKPQEYGKVAVLLGGSSAEREVSLRSGQAVYEGLLKSNVDAIKIDPVDGLLAQLLDNKIERAFIVLHGRDGEDGVVQGFLKQMKIPFTGSDVAGSAIAMNKLISKQIWTQLGIATARYSVIRKGETFSLSQAQQIFTQQGDILFVKPVKEGSSVGMSKVRDASQLIEAVKLAQQFDDLVLIESFISGKEYTVTILNGEALPSIRMQTPREFYDYEAKYQASTTEYFCPSGLNAKDEQTIRSIALNAFKALGCSGWGRVDFIHDSQSNQFLILEANTVPGMTEKSLVPKSALAAGINFQELVLQILDTSFEREVSYNAKS